MTALSRGLIGAALVGCAVLLGAGVVDLADRPFVDHLTLTTAPTVIAGDAIEVVISTNPGTRVTILFIGPYGSLGRSIVVGDTDETVVVDATFGTGSVDVIAVAGALSASAAITVQAGTIGGSVSPLLGARSVVADGTDRAMVAAIPGDRFGNPAEPGTPVQVTVTHPDRSITDRVITVERTLAWMWIPSVTKAGTAIVETTAGGRPPVRRTLLEVPAAPVTFPLAIETELRPADGATLVSVASDVVRDRFGSTMLDGTGASIRAEYPDGTISLQAATTIGGVVRVLLGAPSEPGTVRVTMTVRGVASGPLDVVFHSADLPGADSEEAS